MPRAHPLTVARRGDAVPPDAPRPVVHPSSAAWHERAGAAALRVHLLRVVRTIVRADSDPARRTLFARVVESRPTVRAVHALHRRLAGTRAAACLVSLYGLAALVRVTAPGGARGRILAVAGHENARAQVTRVIAWIGEERCAWVAPRSGAAPAGAWRALRGWRRLRQALRVVDRIDRRHGFLVSCRAAAALAWYARARALFEAGRPGAVVVSSDANPEEAGVLGAARAFDVPRVFVSHAYPTPFSPPLDFSLSILEGEAAVDAYREKGPIAGAVLLAGIHGESAPIDPDRLERPNPVIGIFPPKAFSWETLAAIVEDCRTHFRASRIVIRWHPSMLEPPRLGGVVADLSGIVESDRRAPLADVARQCDWVVAGENSNVHLPVLKLGIPTVAVKGLGLYAGDRADLYGFVAHGIVFPPVRALRDLRAEPLRAFFAAGWAERFGRHDAAYLRPRAEIGASVRHAILALAGGAPRTPLV